MTAGTYTPRPYPRPDTDTVFCEDWCVYFRQRDGSWLQFNSEMWAGWLDLPAGADQRLGSLQQHVLPYLLALPGDILNCAMRQVPRGSWASLDEAVAS